MLDLIVVAIKTCFVLVYIGRSFGFLPLFEGTYYFMNITRLSRFVRDPRVVHSTIPQ